MYLNVPQSRRAGFSLLELLVVIGIIGILSGVMLATFGGATESAKAAQCMTNMRNLAVGAYNCASANSDGVFPAAGSFEYYSLRYLYERKGWISWLNKDNAYWGGKITQSKIQSSWTPYAVYKAGNRSGIDDAWFALTNGTIWTYCGRVADSYVCPTHRNLCKKEKLVPAWSYVMNSLFGYDKKKGKTNSWWGQQLSRVKSLGGGVPLGPDRVLLFAELPFSRIPSKSGKVQNSVELQGNSYKFDCTLQYDDGTWTDPESIGFNHVNGKRYSAHVAFADGHVAKLTLPPDASASDIKDLTTWLCQGDEVAFNGLRYERASKADEKSKN